MKILAIDYGDARIGMAVSDPFGMIAGDAWTMEEWNGERAVERIVEDVKNRSIERIVLGYPKNMDGTLGPRAEKSEALAEKLREKTGLQVILWDERRTTVDAHRILSEA